MTPASAGSLRALPSYLSNSNLEQVIARRSEYGRADGHSDDRNFTRSNSHIGSARCRVIVRRCDSGVCFEMGPARSELSGRQRVSFSAFLQFLQ